MPDTEEAIAADDIVDEEEASPSTSEDLPLEVDKLIKKKTTGKSTNSKPGISRKGGSSSKSRSGR